jgi:hypothetical protein
VALIISSSLFDRVDWRVVSVNVQSHKCPFLLCIGLCVPTKCYRLKLVVVVCLIFPDLDYSNLKT